MKGQVLPELFKNTFPNNKIQLETYVCPSPLLDKLARRLFLHLGLVICSWRAWLALSSKLLIQSPPHKENLRNSKMRQLSKTIFHDHHISTWGCVQDISLPSSQPPQKFSLSFLEVWVIGVGGHTLKNAWQAVASTYFSMLGPTQLWLKTFSCLGFCCLLFLSAMRASRLQPSHG